MRTARSVRAIALTAVLGGLLFGFPWAWSWLQGGRFAGDWNATVPQFRLTNAWTGQVFAYGDHSDRPYVLFFGYSLCNAFCPATLGELLAFQDRVQASGGQPPHILVISIDPERDAEALGQRWGHFKDRMTVLLPGPDSVQAVAGAFRYQIPAWPSAHSGARDQLAHPELVYFLNEKGLIQRLFPAVQSDRIFEFWQESRRHPLPGRY